jgi:hypothetical protein
MKVDVIQTSFAGGEIAPSLFGRTDIVQYQNACEIVENFLVRPYGSVISTPGSEYINTAKTGGSTSISRVISFVFSRTDSYIIEMGVGYFRFYTDGAVVVSTGTTPYEVAHTYTADELFEVQYAQVNDVIYLTHKSHSPKTLTRLASNSWVLANFAFTGGPFLPDNKTATTITPSGTGGSITVAANGNIFIPSSSTMGHINTFWKINTAVTSSTTGLTEQGYVRITAITNPSTATGTVVGQLRNTSATAIWAEGSWSDVRGWPARVTFHQKRLCLARTNAQPQNIWASKSFVYENFALDGGAADDALDIPLASTESNEINWLVSGDNLIAGTYGGDFIIRSTNDGPLTPETTSASKQSSWGSEPIQPKRVGNFFYYAQRFGQKLRELFYIWDLNSYKSIDKTILSPHIAGDGFKDIAYQQTPDTILWLVKEDGTIATLTREIDQEVQGWSRQITDGYYESVASIPSRDEPHDEIWVVVRRNINGSDVRYIERFKSMIVPDRQDQCFYVHSGLSYDAFLQTTLGTASTISLSATGGTSVVTSSSARFTAQMVGKRIRAVDSEHNIVGELDIIGYTSSTIVIGDVKYQFDNTSYAPGSWGVSVSEISGLDHLEGESVSVLGDGGNDKPLKVVSSGSITLAYNYFVVNAGLPYTQKIKTLPKEAGAQRGTAQGKKQRINEIALKVNRSHRGFFVGGDEDLLDVVSYQASPSSSVIYLGTIPNTDLNLTKVVFRDPTTLMGTPELLYTGIIPNIYFRDDYRYGSKVVIQNEDPLPIELLSLTTTVSTMEK